MRNDNKGFSLIELIIIIAIMSIVLTMLVANLGYANSSAAKGCANSLKTAIGQTRIKTMGKKETYLYVYKDGKGYSMKTISKGSKTGDPITVEATEQLAKSKVSIKYSFKKADGSMTTPVELDSSNDILIGFNRENGKLDMSSSSITFEGMTKNVTSTSNETGIVFNVQSGNFIYDITIYGATGKVEMARR
ncbi:MAG: prepilin-type N-terminal cleavage/methylation domain-containing protein [Lachnospiraceae bacterium]|nr:prepilin-type N-terminal cleavage/methylation domain-containing protein [Lachnospiraceae bacterium]